MAKAESKTPAKAKGPSPQQLEQIKSGGDYTFDPETGEFTQTRAPAKPQPKGGK